MTLKDDDVFTTTEAGADDRVKDQRCYEKFALETYLGVPLVVSGEVWGTLSFSSVQPRREPFDQMDIELAHLGRPEEDTAVRMLNDGLVGRRLQGKILIAD